MPEKMEALGIFLILLPGFLAAYITQQLSVRREQTELDKLIEALVFSFVVYCLTLPFFGWHLPLTWQEVSPGEIHLQVVSSEMLSLFGVSFFLGIIYASSTNHDWLLSFFRKIRITERTARRSIWNDAFQELGGFAQIELKDGKRVIGWVRYYSDQSEDSSIFLERAAWVEEDGSETAIDGPGILLTKECGIESVTFLSWKTSDARDPAKPEMHA